MEESNKRKLPDDIQEANRLHKVLRGHLTELSKPVASVGNENVENKPAVVDEKKNPAMFGGKRETALAVDRYEMKGGVPAILERSRDAALMEDEDDSDLSDEEGCPVVFGRGADSEVSDKEDDRVSTDKENGEVVQHFPGEESGVDRQEEDGQRFTAFNLREEQQEGHFDSAGNFIWNKKDTVRDDWVDNLAPIFIQKPGCKRPVIVHRNFDVKLDWEKIERGSLIRRYRKILALMQPGETVLKTIRRLAGNRGYVSSMDRLRLSKAGMLNKVNSENIEKISSLANEIFVRGINVNVYEMTYEQIADKVQVDNASVSATPLKVLHYDLDMYADDFGEKEKAKMAAAASTSVAKVKTEEQPLIEGSCPMYPYDTDEEEEEEEEDKVNIKKEPNSVKGENPDVIII